MATFKAVVRWPRSDGFYSVYIRVTHRRQTLFIKTDKMLTKRELSRKGEIADAFVLSFCTQKILEYQERLGHSKCSGLGDGNSLVNIKQPPGQSHKILIILDLDFHHRPSFLRILESDMLNIPRSFVIPKTVYSGV